MPILAKFPGKCWMCGLPVVVGVDHYDTKTKRNSHILCEIDPPFDREAAEQIAERCGFIRLDDFTAGVFRDWALLLVSRQDRDTADGPERTNDDSHQQQGSLFGVRKET